MRGVLVVGGVALGLFVAGCHPGNRPTGGGGGGGGSVTPPPPPPPFDMSATPTGGSGALTGNIGTTEGLSGGSAGDVSGILAGKVIDSWGRGRPKARIEIRPASEVGDPGSKPVVLESDAQGYFVVPGLKPGRTYSMQASLVDGGKRLSGEVQAAPPMSRLVLSLATEAAPPRPPAGSRPLTPSESGPPSSGGFVAPPVAGASSIADTGAPPLRAGVPTTIPAPPPPAPPIGPGAAAPTVRPRVAAEIVPVSLVSGARVDDIILPDLDGGSWSLAQDRKGKLVLLDFWGTWCPACLQATPSLNDLHRVYGSQGLEVVGVACENDQARRSKLVAEMRERLRIGYRVLLGGSPREGDPVQKDLRVQVFPTLILLDADGNQVWRGNHKDIAGLERTIRARLDLR